ncbi:type III-B CRISPR module RAMP protein Cmr6 [Candidatus Methylocalor cossyra]|uniref:CRISPR-associated RAMP Cmr6 n=1 Tax=Candidatus Methylocalor cossyra TaxID=3108543 RepID=A0ABM9NK89_9GAMM
MLPVPSVYQAAYARWRNTVIETETIAFWAGRIDGRMFLGLGGASVLETAITLGKTYGVPFIPGSAQKGLASAYAKAAGIDKQHRDILFGKVGNLPEQFESGAVLFHDAWWIPGSSDTPLAQEIVTVHHPEYYKGGEKDATDFDSPEPNVQIAARGSFLFTVECGEPKWAEFARDILSEALKHWGIGGKTAAGYGYFVPDTRRHSELEGERHEWRQRRERAAEEARRAAMAPEELAIQELRQLFEKEKKSGNPNPSGPLSDKRTELLRTALTWESPHWRGQAADLIEETAKFLPWSKKSRDQRRAEIAQLRKPPVT